MQNESMYHMLTKMIEGDQHAFHTLYDATYRDVYRTVYFLVDHPHDREDIMNEIYMQMWTSLPNYDPNRPFHFWLHGLVIRQGAEIPGEKLEEIPNFRTYPCLFSGRASLGSADDDGWDRPRDIEGHAQAD